MTRTVTAVFDGETLRPSSPVDLEPNTRYLITIREAPHPEKRPSHRDLRAATPRLETPSSVLIRQERDER